MVLSWCDTADCCIPSASVLVWTHSSCSKRSEMMRTRVGSLKAWKTRASRAAIAVSTSDAGIACSDGPSRTLSRHTSERWAGKSRVSIVPMYECMLICYHGSFACQATLWKEVNQAMCDYETNQVCSSCGCTYPRRPTMVASSHNGVVGESPYVVLGWSTGIPVLSSCVCSLPY